MIENEIALINKESVKKAAKYVGKQSKPVLNDYQYSLPLAGVGIGASLVMGGDAVVMGLAFSGIVSSTFIEFALTNAGKKKNMRQLVGALKPTRKPTDTADATDNTDAEIKQPVNKSHKSRLRTKEEKREKLNKQEKPVTINEEGAIVGSSELEQDQPDALSRLSEIKEVLGVYVKKSEIKKIVDDGLAFDVYFFTVPIGTKIGNIDITSLSRDLMLDATTFAFIEPNAGHGTAALFVPKQKRRFVMFDVAKSGGYADLSMLKEQLDKTAFGEFANDATLPIMIGETVYCEQTYFDLEVDTHAIVAGASNSGKTSSLTFMLYSMLAYNKEVKLVIFDRKSALNPSMLLVKNRLAAPICNSIEDIYEGVKKVYKLTLSRKSAFEKANVKDIYDYNRQFPDKKVTNIVVVMDELQYTCAAGDTFTVVEEDDDGKEKKVEYDYGKEISKILNKTILICRSLGINFLFGTQNLMKKVTPHSINENCPTRFVLKLANSMDSTTMIGVTGAEYCLGKGDGYLKTNGMQKPVKAQSYAINFK